MNAKQTNEGKIYVYGSFVSLPLCFWCRSYVQLLTEIIASYANVYYRNRLYPEVLGVGNND